MIRPVGEIPQSTAQKRESYRQKIRDDIQAAIDNGPGKYEFIGDYNFKYLHQYAREEADRFWRNLFLKITRPHYSEWKERFQQKYIFLNDWEFRGFSFIKIISVKGEKDGEKRVFCEIFDREEAERKALEACEKRLAEHQRQDQERDEKEKRKLKMEANDETESFDFSEELT